MTLGSLLDLIGSTGGVVQCCSGIYSTTPAGRPAVGLVSIEQFTGTAHPGLLPSGFFNARKTLLPPRWIKKSRFAPGFA
jgi:hypothetical protein